MKTLLLKHVFFKFIYLPKNIYIYPYIEQVISMRYELWQKIVNRTTRLAETLKSDLKRTLKLELKRSKQKQNTRSRRERSTWHTILN